MCQTLTQGTKCIDQICQCPLGEKYVKGDSYRCVSTIFNSCSDDSECSTSVNGLSCLNFVCSCGENNEICTNEAFNTCEYNYECVNNLECIGNKCTCPREVGNEYFFKGNKCVHAAAFGNKCKSNEQCQFMTENTRCIKGSCQCEATGLFNSSFCLTCLTNWTLIRESCFIQSSQRISIENNIPFLDFEYIQDICYNVASARLGRIYNHELKFVVSFFEAENDSDSMYIDAQQQDESSSNFISIDKQFILPYKLPYWSKSVNLPINDSCLVINSNFFFEPDKCNKEYFILCEYEI